MAASTAQTIEKMEIRKNYRNVWHTDLMSTMQTDPCYCCLSIWCSPCVSYLLRKRALYDDMSRYVCCAGYMPCSGKCGESNCPEVCLCTEVLCCFGNSVASTRFLLQDEFNIQTTQCDNFIIAFMLCLQQLACICSLIACILGSDELSDAAEILRCLSDLVYCTVCACMQTQHKVEMDKRDGMFGPGPMAIPPIQQMSRIDQPIPPAVGYPPQQSYGGAYGYQPQPSPYAQGNLPPPVYDQYGQGHQLAGYPPPAYDQYGQVHPPAGYPLPVHDQNPLAYPPPAHDQSTYPPPPPGTYPPPPPGAYPPPGKQPPPPPPPPGY